MSETGAQTERTAGEHEVRWGGDSIARFHLRRDEGSVEIRESAEDSGRTLELPYVFGRLAVVQYLADAGSGRLQALPVAYDPRRDDWFDIFEGERREPGDWGHWNGGGMNANSQCVECHATGYAKNYVSTSQGYNSSWAELGVGCEACHGPGRDHVAARKNGHGDAYPAQTGERLADLCASCHSLRRTVADGFLPGARFLDHYDPVLLDEGVYFADGQFDAESYEWGSFLQSRMHGEGVVCGDCHDAHSGNLRAEGDALCLGCHDSALATPAHTHHDGDGSGAPCVDCHMPTRVYMARDERRDHSFPVPDAELSAQVHSSNACLQCHTDQDLPWAAEHLAAWSVVSGGPLQEGSRERADAARAFAETAKDEAQARSGLVEVADASPNAFRRASAVKLLARYVSPAAPTGNAQVLAALERAAEDDEALVRNAAAWALSEARVPLARTGPALLRLADDPLRSVRVQAAWGLRSVDPSMLTDGDRQRVERAFQEWIVAAQAMPEVPETHHSLGVFLAARGDSDGALAAYRRAIEIEPKALPARHNLAMLLLALGRIDESEREFRAALEHDAEFAPALNALATIAAERGRWGEAAELFHRVLVADSTFPGALTELSRAYFEAGAANVARVTLEDAAAYPRPRREALLALVELHTKLAEPERARKWAQEAAADFPDLADDPRVKDLLAD